jgi:alpha-L-glutamate ligase-like protein
MDHGPTIKKNDDNHGTRLWLVKRYSPFSVFMLGYGVFCVYLQLEFQNALAQLFLVRIFFQITIAALIIASVKNVSGLRTLGTFGPAIVALAFLATGLPLGLALFAIVLGAILLTRIALTRENVQADHRVAILVTLVTVTMSSIVLLGLEIGQHILFFTVLFPVLITAWIGERYVERVTRVGWKGPSLELVGTLFVVVIAFFVIIQDFLVDFVIVNPVTWFLLVLANWFLGTRLRLRISERFRFWGPIHYGGGGTEPGDFGEGILTMVVRNRDYVAKYNSPSLMARLGKDETKKLIVVKGIPVPKTFLVAKDREGVNNFKAWLANHNKFVLKPASGYGGEGILLVKSRGPEGYYETNSGPMRIKDIKAHALSIVEGEFHDRQGDAAIVEELLTQDPSLKSIVPIGLADFRVICLLGFPVMAMMRIPTKASGGKANLHLGAVAAAVQISTGIITHVTLHGSPQPSHPDTGDIIVGQKVPAWDEILEIAAEAQRYTGLGFAGVDVALDAILGPVVMEVNRRPGLEIQNANAAGLLQRLQMIESLPRKERPVEERIRIVKQLDASGWQTPLSSPETGTAGEGESLSEVPGHGEEPKIVPVGPLPAHFYHGKQRMFRAILLLFFVILGASLYGFEVGGVNYTELLGPHVQRSEWAFTMTGVRGLNAQGFTGKGVTVCIVDSGIDALHPDFAHSHIVAWWDLVNFRPTPYDDRGHGTAMAGIIAAKGSFQGAAPDVDLIIVKALNATGKGTSENVANGVHLCLHPGRGLKGADIISLSLGRAPQPNGQPNQSQDTKVYDAVAWATAQGVFVVAAAGNLGPSSGDVDLSGQPPLAISVAAVDGNGQKATFSSIGSLTNRTSPDLKPEVAAPGVRILSTGTGARYLTVTGTSPAAALTAAILALMLQARPHLRGNGSWKNILTVKEALASTANKVPDQTLPHDVSYGYGIIDGEAALAKLSCDPAC